MSFILWVIGVIVVLIGGCAIEAELYTRRFMRDLEQGRGKSSK